MWGKRDGWWILRLSGCWGEDSSHELEPAQRSPSSLRRFCFLETSGPRLPVTPPPILRVRILLVLENLFFGNLTFHGSVKPFVPLL